MEGTIRADFRLSQWNSLGFGFLDLAGLHRVRLRNRGLLGNDWFFLWSRVRLDRFCAIRASGDVDIRNPRHIVLSMRRMGRTIFPLSRNVKK
jgi:hypothetical protein